MHSKLKRLRIGKRLTQTAAARAIPMSDRAYNTIENRSGGACRIETQDKIAAYFGVPASELFDKTGKAKQ